MLVLFTLLIVALAAGESPAGDGQCVEGDTNDPTCSSPDRAAGLDTAACCQRLGVCEQKALSMRLLQAAAEVPSRSPPRPTAIAAPAIAGTPLSDGLRALLTRDQEDESLPFLVSTGHSPANLTLTYVDDGDLSALAELLARVPKLHTLALPSHALSLLGAGALAATVRDAAPQLERLKLGEYELPLAPLRPAAKSASLALRGKSLTLHDLVVVTAFLHGGGEGPGPSSGPDPYPWPRLTPLFQSPAVALIPIPSRRPEPAPSLCLRRRRAGELGPEQQQGARPKRRRRGGGRAARRRGARAAQAAPRCHLARRRGGRRACRRLPCGRRAEARRALARQQWAGRCRRRGAEQLPGRHVARRARAARPFRQRAGRRWRGGARARATRGASGQPRAAQLAPRRGGLQLAAPPHP